MCNDCFFMFPRKLCTDKCPACTQKIVTYIVLTPKEQSAEKEIKDSNFESQIVQFYNVGEEMDYQELLKQAAGLNGKEFTGVSANDDDYKFDCLDHAYFIEELKKLLCMHKQTEQDYWKRGERPTSYEQQALDQIAERALDLQFACHQFQHFDPNVMLVEVNELSEMLCKVSSGKFKSETG